MQQLRVLAIVLGLAAFGMGCEGEAPKPAPPKAQAELGKPANSSPKDAKTNPAPAPATKPGGPTK